MKSKNTLKILGATFVFTFVVFNSALACKDEVTENAKSESNETSLSGKFVNHAEEIDNYQIDKTKNEKRVPASTQDPNDKE